MLLTEGDLEKCKYQVLNEIKSVEKKQWTYLQKKYSFLTDRQSINLSIGNETCIKKITIDNIIDFVHNNYCNYVFIQFSDEELEYKKSSELISKINISEDRKIQSNILIYPYTSANNITIYEYFFRINFRYVSIKTMVLKLLFEIIMEKKISLYDYCSEQKIIKYTRINQNYLFFEISYKISKCKVLNIKNEMFNFFKFLKNIFIFSEDLIYAKISLHNYLKAARHTNKRYIIDQIANHFLYGYPLVIDSKSFDRFSIVIDSISLENINDFKYNILSVLPKVVITDSEL